MTKKEIIEWLEFVFAEADSMQGCKRPEEAEYNKERIAFLKKIVMPLVKSTPATLLKGVQNAIPE